MKVYYKSIFILVFSGIVFSCDEDEILQNTITVTDIDGNVYQTIQIGTQTWMKENLRVRHYNDSTPIPVVNRNSDWASLTTGACCYNDNDSAGNAATYGVLYNFFALEDHGGIAPPGWHIPSDDEWKTLENYLGGITVAGGKMKETGILHWDDPNVSATNSSGFTALPGGGRYQPDGTFSTIGGGAAWWSITDINPAKAWSRYMISADGNLYTGLNWTMDGFSVRCIKD